MKSNTLIIIILTIFLVSCGQERVLTPKPRMYPKIEFPQQEYQDFNEAVCSFIFRQPSYTAIAKGVKFFDEDPIHPCWFDLQLTPFNGSLHFSYYPINQENQLDKLVADAYKIAGKHNVKANYIDELLIRNEYGVNGLMFEIEGEVASPLNFYLTDSTNHFVRASLYFNSSVNADSIQPIIDFVRTDIDSIITSFQFL